MGKFTIAELQAVREKAAAVLNEPNVFHLMVCGGTGCHATGSIAVKDALVKEITDKVKAIGPNTHFIKETAKVA